MIFSQVTYKGEMHLAVVTGLKRDFKKNARFDKNNLIFINDKYEPLGNRITGPLPIELRGDQRFSKLLSLCKEYV